MPPKECVRRESALAPSVVWRRMTGVGCFGKPATLINMLHRVMAQYERGAGRMDALRICPSPVGCAARHLINRLSLECRAPEAASPPSEARQTACVRVLFLYG